MKLSDLLQKLEMQASNLETLSHDIDMCISSAQEIDRVVTTSIKEIKETVQSVKDAQDRIKETL
tara:strand:- start:648 stop:839 length:192 start_codon:yes stop_codon:yes gene_type:complete